MLSRSITASAALALILATGAGCLPFGSDDKQVAAPTGGMWVTADAGRTWASSNALPKPDGVSSIAPVNAYTLEIDPSDSTVMYLGTVEHGLFVTYDAGVSWARFEDPLTLEGSILGVEVDPRNVCTFYVLKRDRLMKTTTCGREFDTQTYVETRSNVILRSMAIDWYNPNVLWVGTSGGDLLKTSDGGDNWSTNTRVSSAIMDLEVSNADSRVILLASQAHGLYRSSDAGATWVSYREQMDTFRNSDKAYDLAQTADGSTMLMSSEYGILKSADQGFTWEKVPLVTASNEVEVRAIGIAPNNGNILYYGTGSTFYRSTSGGSAWSTTELPTARAASVIQPDTEDENKVFLGVRSLEE